MYTKSFVCLILLAVITATATAFIHPVENNDKPIYIPSSEQRIGDSAKGWNYLIYGDYLKSGIPYPTFTLLMGKDKQNVLNRTGKAANIPYNFNLVTTEKGIEVVVPTCLQCDAQVFDGKLYVGLGNTELDFSNFKSNGTLLQNMGMQLMKWLSPKQFAATKALTQSLTAISPYLKTEVRGVNAADRLATLLVAHRNPETLQWLNEPILSIPNEVIPTDVPAWWLLKKKHAMFYNGFGRGDFGKFLMLSNLLTVKDTSEAAEVNGHFGDVLAFINRIQAPKYPFAIDSAIALKGKNIFINHCSKCHGTYDKGNETYPNLLIPASIIQTDSLLYQSNHQNPQFIEWFNKSWFATSNQPAKLVPASGYVAPPLDGIWITAPYLHNGSVPTLEALLNSKKRPTYWKRNFKNPTYDYENIGWKYEPIDKNATSKEVYNTTLKGYSNSGHYFGDKLSDADRKALIVFLKTL